MPVSYVMLSCDSFNIEHFYPPSTTIEGSGPSGGHRYLHWAKQTCRFQRLRSVGEYLHSNDFLFKGITVVGFTEMIYSGNEQLTH